MFKNALVSCSDKAGLADFLRALQAHGLRVVSTGGTGQLLRENGVSVVDVSEQTGFQEVMDGRVKTLHPKVHMALLARDNDPEDMQTLSENEIEPFDLVIGNLYPFESSPSVDTIDIGGPSFLRAAAKNYERILVVCDPADYAWILAQKKITLEDRKRMAAKVFTHTAAYDSMIASHLADGHQFDFKDHALGGELVQSLRYGENPHQKAAWYRTRGLKSGVHQAKILQGKELSYNNLLDIESAIEAVRKAGSTPACVAVKHNSPCGAATHSRAQRALELAVQADPQSVFGGILAVNFAMTVEMADFLKSIFLECVVAPKFEPDAVTQFSNKKNLRLLEWPDFNKVDGALQYRSVSGGFLVQEKDHVETSWDPAWVVHGDSISEVQADLLFAWKICSSLKSNAIAIVSEGQTVGLGMGQVNRIDAVEQAIDRNRRFHPEAKNRVLASDAFFPFPDSIEKIAQAGIRFVIQPAGSIKDNEVIAAAKKLGVTLVMTSQRHFLH